MRYSLIKREQKVHKSSSNKNKRIHKIKNPIYFYPILSLNSISKKAKNKEKFQLTSTTTHSGVVDVLVVLINQQL